MSAKELFDRVVNNDIPQIDMADAIKKLTDDGNGIAKSRLETLLRDFTWYLQDFVDQAIAIIRYNANPASETRKEMESWLKESRSEKYANLIFLDVYYRQAGLNEKKMASITKFYFLLKTQIEKLDDEASKTSNLQPIQWLKEESLRQFLESIKKAGLIKNRDTDEIIHEHFRQTNQTPQPIQWSKSNRLLIYLFNKLSEAGLVDTMDRQFKLITEHFLDKKGQPFKRDSIKQDSQNMKYSSDPRGSKTIDRIIQELTD